MSVVDGKLSQDIETTGAIGNFPSGDADIH